MRPCRFTAFLLIILSPCAAAPSAHAWGCKGHQAIALIAESHLTPHAREAALSILAAAPIDPNLPRYCGPNNDPFADASTWADDVRKLRPDTAPWHFIDIPRGARKSDIAKYCPSPQGCVTSALADEMRVLRDPHASPQASADALRFLIHFVGDIHQPLHASTNNDLGGNCVPVTFFGRAPVESTPGSGAFNPNLHSIWDVDIIEHFSPGESSQDFANQITRGFSLWMPEWEAQTANFSAWAWESHEMAEQIAYGQLPHRIPIAMPRLLNSCSDLTDSERARLLQLNENVADDYESVAAPIAEQQIAKAGARLAALLNSLWP